MVALRHYAEQRFTCAQCGRCCRRGWDIALTAGEVEGYRKAGAAAWYTETDTGTETGTVDPFEPLSGQVVMDFALEALDATETHDFYQVVVERHRRASAILTSNREPQEWLALMADPMLAQSAVDRVVKVWDTASGLETLSLTGHRQDVVLVRFRPDGRELASASRDGVVRLWQAGK